MKNALAAIQWSLIMLAGCVVAPITIGEAFGFSQEEIIQFVQQTLLVMGVVAILQSLFGHKLPVIEAPAAVWWGIFLALAVSVSSPGERGALLVSLQMGIMMSGVLFLLLSVTGMIRYIRRLFTPLVTGTYFVLLVAQMSGPFIKGILGIGYLTSTLQGKTALAGVLTTICAVMMARSPIRWVRIYSVLWAICGGWALFVLLDLNQPMTDGHSEWFVFPQVFPWGIPQFNTSVLFIVAITTLLLLTNLVASIEAVEKVVKSPRKTVEWRSGFVLGISQLLSGVFGTISFIPVSYTAGFILTTKTKERLPFIMGSALILGISFFPAISMFFAMIPSPVGYAAVFISFAQMLGLGLKEYTVSPLDEERILIIGISLMVGLGCMALPLTSLTGIAPIFTTFLSNGLAMGVVTCMLLEQGMRLNKVGRHRKGAL
ncbi:purine/pyrimidine permease [Ammoniphilus sp. CFH 90114]|uniref:purine/pyrimidine permease n=1 Tax=Ammoniphilus sp. CFH 90114 TaxID=2493665 RepID=UPI00100FE847|nr:purine/pyrimidine permease [Ammoniphilus sp. CFH 90114]RXT04929.1 xanthine permease [Ammoniphilus sp. CFH 90114]